LAGTTYLSLALPLFMGLAGAQTAPNWTQLSPQNSPPGRQNFGMVYDSAHSQAVLFGGADAAFNSFGDTWVFDGTNWSQVSQSGGPPARYLYGMAYDAQHGQTVVFGGIGPGDTDLNDTWLWDGSNWSDRTPATSPPTRDSQAMAYDSVHGQVVLFGGYSPDSGDLNDTWLWNGSGWTQSGSATNPQPRDSHAMAYDAIHHQVVLFGGVNSSHILLSDTWVWDGTSWTQKMPTNIPPARVYQSMAFDSAHGQVVMFGGQGNSGDLNDTWIWDGNNWTQEAPATNPSTRDSQAMAFDSTHGQVVMFGGSRMHTALADTWAWVGSNNTPNVPMITSVISASGYGGFSAVAPGSWVEIYGSNLAATTREWAGSDFTGNNAPTSLGGVQVTIGGQKAFVEYITSNPAQINAQLPSNIPTGGMLPLTVTNGTQTSAAYNIMVNSTEPGLLAPSAFKTGGNQYVVALLPDGATYILPTGAIPSVASRPAHPGDTITMYGIGFGAVMPNIPAGQIAAGSTQLAASLQILFGQTSALMTYVGQAPGFVGLYQFDVVVPAVPDNDLVPLTFNLGGVAGTQTLYIAVHQ
jgi:uncharacterized protein (TIGR03437 family)